MPEYYEEDEEINRVGFNGIYGVRTNRGYIELLLNEKVASRWDVKKAKEIRDMLSEAIEACISDELIVKFFMNKLNLNQEKAAMVLMDFRELRQGTKKTVYPQ